MSEMADGPDSGLDELSRERLAEGRRILAGLTAERDALAEACSAALDKWQYSRRRGDTDDLPAVRAMDAWEVADKFGALSAEQLRCLLFAAAERLAPGGQQYTMTADCFRELAELPLDLSAGDVRLLAAVAEPGTRSDGHEPFKFVVELVRKLLDEATIGAAALAETIADQVLGWNAMTSYPHAITDYALDDADSREEVARLRDAALELAGRPAALPGTEGAVSRDDGWGLAVIAWLGPVEDWPAGVAALLEHCAMARSARPLARWEKACQLRIAAVADAAGLLRGLLGLVVTAEPVSYLNDQGRRIVLLGHNEQLVKGLVWAAGLVDPGWLPAVLHAVAVRCLRLCSGHVFRDTAVPGEKIPYACFRSLARSGSDAALIALARIGRATANRGVLRQLGKTLEEVSARLGMSPASLLDRLTPDLGLDADGQVSITAAGGRWTIRLDDRHGGVLAGPDDGSAVTEPAPAEVTQLLAEIRATVSMARARLEEMFAERREMHVEDFLDCHVRHPVGGWLATRMVWVFSPADPGVEPGAGAADEVVSGFPARDGRTVRTAAGERAVPAGCVVRLLHPVLTGAAELGQLRNLAADLRIIQPVRQLWRETYRLSDAERHAGLYSDRYAGHVLRFGQCYGLARRRGWAGGFLSGAWDGGDSAVARRDYRSAGLRASWAISRLDGLSTEVAVDLCLTQSVAFSPLDDVEPAPVSLAEVPAEVFSEAMRDLDLIVSVTTVANDPMWLEEYRGQPVLDEYWEHVVRDGLDGLRTHRREVLAPWYRDRPGQDGHSQHGHSQDGHGEGRFELTERELIVRGSLATYRIDLATANVRMEPAGTWLSFDTRLPEPAGGLELSAVPALDDDEILQRILVRAAILADDEHVASRRLLKQIKG